MTSVMSVSNKHSANVKAARMAVAVVSYNTAQLLHDCLASIPDGTRVVVVDNGSTDGSIEMTRTAFPSVRLIVSEQNAGYGAAANRAIAACGQPYVLLLNSDTVLKPGVIDILTSYLESNPHVGVAGPRLLNPDGTHQASCFPFPGTVRWLIENDPFAAVVRIAAPFRNRTLRYSPPDRSMRVPWVLGAALAFRRKAFDEAEGFDESFFMYFEEVDICLRMAGLKWETHFVNDAEVVHKGAASTGQLRSQMALEHFRSTLRFYRQHYSGARQAFWISAMRLKMATRLVRDRFRLIVASSAQRRALTENVQTWRSMLREP